MWPKPLRVYLDTSIFNFAVSAQDVAHEKEITLRFLECVMDGRFIAHVSPIVFDEIRQASQKKQDELFDLMERYALETLSRTEEVDALADRYIEQKIIPKKHYDDALHIGMASVYNLDVIVSWNFEHLVKFKTRREVQAVNILMGYKTIEICSPQEVI